MIALIAPFICFGTAASILAQQKPGATDLDTRVSRFLQESRDSWSDWNVPYPDGKILHDLVVKGGYRNILEIGTSTGHSTVWLAWAASKTGGKVTTIEIDEERHRTALANFKKAGVESFIDARIGDAHRLVPALPGPFDFVFSDADKDWYLRYFKAVAPKLRLNGCFTAHNVLWKNDTGIREFLDYVTKDPKFRTTIEKGSGEGISVSYKIKE